MDQDIHKGTFALDHLWIRKLLYWASSHYPFVSYFNPNDEHHPQGGFNHVFYAGRKEISLSAASSARGKHRVGIVSYDQKNQYEKLNSTNPPLVNCPDLLFFLAELHIEFIKDQLIIHHPAPQALFDKVSLFELPSGKSFGVEEITPLLSKESYLEKFEHIQNHIREGDIYEMNFCMAHQMSFECMDPVALYLSLCKISPMPFSALFKANDLWVVGASPERFLKKTGEILITQPIKGSIRRGETREEDDDFVAMLKSSEKERAENLMIVDLMRNDLSKVAQIGEVWVDELFGVYRFKRISQMISTVACRLKERVSFDDILRSTFPMGSMTGTPKIKCMELIDRHENFKRGWFSGSIGYITDTDDFDWNVVIRSIIIDQQHRKLYFAVGSAITVDADPLCEYEECLLKSQTIFEALRNSLL